MKTKTVRVTKTVSTATWDGRTFPVVPIWWDGEWSRAYVDGDGSVRAYDSVAGHYVLSVPLTERQRLLIRRLLACTTRHRGD